MASPPSHLAAPPAPPVPAEDLADSLGDDSADPADPADPAAPVPGSRPAPVPNAAFRALRGDRSPAEFAAAVRRAAREIGEQVSCDARYVGRVEAGEIRCPNYAYERVFRHMFPGRTPADLGFEPRERVRGRRAREAAAARSRTQLTVTVPAPPTRTAEESDVLRRAFMTGGTAAVATALAASPAPALAAPPVPLAGAGSLAAPLTGRLRAARRAGAAEARALADTVRRIRLLDDRHGAGGLYRQATAALRAAGRLLDETGHDDRITAELCSGAGELALSTGWLAHDSGRFEDARSHYGEALALSRVSGDPALEAHAFCNTAFLARDAGHPREAVRAAHAGTRAAARLGSARLLSLLALREAGGLAGLGDRSGCERALTRAHRFFAQGPADADPEWMSFFGEAELSGLEAQAWAALGDHHRATGHARRAVALQDPHFTRNIALYGAELAGDLARSGEPDEAADAASRALGLLAGSRPGVHSPRIRGMLRAAARALRPYAARPAVADYLARQRP
jgi:tetratricopeptide (TPR) repeat protein